MIKPIRNDLELKVALKRLYDLIQKNLEPNTQDGDEFEVLSVLVETYEKEHHPVPPPSPIGAIEFALECKGLQKSDLGKILGSRSRAHEILTGKRKLSIAMIRTLHKELGIPAEILIQEYQVAA